MPKDDKQAFQVCDGIGTRDNRSDPFVWVNLEFCDLDIDPASKSVYLEIARRARRGDGAGACWESVEHIAHWANVSIATAKRSLKRLIEWGMILRESRGGQTSLYRLTDRSMWTAPYLEKPATKHDRGRPKTAQVTNELAQIKPSSNLTQVKNGLRGGSNLAQLGGSNLAHKLDPIELDPIELDPLTSEQRCEAVDSAKEESRTAADPKTVQPEMLSLSVEKKLAIGEDQFSAAKSESFENLKDWQTFCKLNHRPPWRLPNGEFHSLMVRAVHQSGGSTSGKNIYDLPSGAINKPKINKILRRLDTSASYGGYSPKDDSTQELCDFWELACDLEGQVEKVVPTASSSENSDRLRYQSYSERAFERTRKVVASIFED